MSAPVPDREALIAAAAQAIWEGTPGRIAREPTDRDALPAQLALDAVLPLVADAIEALEWSWHFRGPGDSGIKIVSRKMAVDLVRSFTTSEVS